VLALLNTLQHRLSFSSLVTTTVLGMTQCLLRGLLQCMQLTALPWALLASQQNHGGPQQGPSFPSPWRTCQSSRQQWHLGSTLLLHPAAALERRLAASRVHNEASKTSGKAAMHQSALMRRAPQPNAHEQAAGHNSRLSLQYKQVCTRWCSYCRSCHHLTGVIRSHTKPRLCLTYIVNAEALAFLYIRGHAPGWHRRCLHGQRSATMCLQVAHSTPSLGLALFKKQALQRLGPHQALISLSAMHRSLQQLPIAASISLADSTLWCVVAYRTGPSAQALTAFCSLPPALMWSRILPTSAPRMPLSLRLQQVLHRMAPSLAHRVHRPMESHD
jgi:hypothetical protein